MKYRPKRTALSHEQANEIFQGCQQAIQTEKEVIDYWGRKKEPLSQIDSFILMAGKFANPEEAINASKNRIDYEADKMQDMRRFFDPQKKILKIF